MLIHGSAFTGIGLLDYGLCLAGLGEPVWVCEQDEWRRESILARRFPGAVRYDDVRAVGAGCEPVELIVGGFPCKGASTAGLRNGFDHAETVLWREMARAIGELRPRYVLVENVANILALHDGAVWGEVLGDLAALRYNVVWDCLPAAAVGAPHLRDRVLAVATDATRCDGQGSRAERPALGRAAPDAVEPLANATREPQRDAHDAAHAFTGGGEAWQVPDLGATVAPPDAQRDPIREQPEPERGRSGQTVAGGRAEAAPDARRAGRQERDRALAGAAQHAGAAHDAQDAADADGSAPQPAGSQRRGEPQGAGEPLAVDWGAYELAIRRWERALGRRAGEPLLQGVVARDARRLVRSRLSALGDGVQVQVGAIAGAYILDRERERLAHELVPDKRAKVA